MPPTDRRRDVLDSLGRAIVAGEMAPGQSLTLEAIQSQYGVSRTLARDCVHTLESVGVVASRRRVGIVVQPREHWSALAPQLVRWQLQADPHGPKLGALTELRAAIEPVAAAAAARRVARRVIIDARNALVPSRWTGAGWDYRGIGRPRPPQQRRVPTPRRCAGTIVG